MNIVFLSLGTNLGDRVFNIETAIEQVKSNIGKIIRFSSIYISEPWGFSSKEMFLNRVLVAETKKSPEKVLFEIKQIESEMGRIKTSDFYESRVIDIDILFYNNSIVNKPQLKIPHPLLHERLFILLPLNEIAPFHDHPVFNKKIFELINMCNDKSMVELMEISHIQTAK